MPQGPGELESLGESQPESNVQPLWKSTRSAEHKALFGWSAGPSQYRPTPYEFGQRRSLHKKSFLEFIFPNKLVARLPFYENIEITEKKQANLVTYDPIGRSSSLYSYAGALSLIHI